MKRFSYSSGGRSNISIFIASIRNLSHSSSLLGIIGDVLMHVVPFQSILVPESFRSQ